MSNQDDNTKVFKAPEFGVNKWIDANGDKTEAIKLSDHQNYYWNPDNSTWNLIS